MTADPMANPTSNHLWQLLWEHNPNGLIVVDADMYIRVVNPAFCRMFKIRPEAAIAEPAETILDDVSDLKKVWSTGTPINGKAREYAQFGLYVNQVMFPIFNEGIVACIMVDMSHALKQRRELNRLKRETIKEVNHVVDNQMKVVQEIAGLLGETTAETKVSLLKIIQMIQPDDIDGSLYPNQPDA